MSLAPTQPSTGLVTGARDPRSIFSDAHASGSLPQRRQAGPCGADPHGDREEAGATNSARGEGTRYPMQITKH